MENNISAGKCALVTGSTKGIGLAISKKLADKGYFVYTNSRDDDTASTELDTGNHCIIKADLSTPYGAEYLTEFIRNRAAPLDCVVLNAGTTCRKDFGEIEYDDWNKVMNTNVNIPFLICQSLFPVIADFGSIVFIGSDMGIYPHSVSTAYSVSKSATHMLAQSLVKECADRNIRVNAIAPGFIDTQWQKEKPDWLREKIEQKIALKRFGTPEEIADACMFLIENTYINGSIVQVDGGYNCF